MINKSNNLIKLEEAVCDLCGCSKKKELYSMPDLRFKLLKKEYTVVQCHNCGHRYMTPRPSPDSISILYPKDYYANRGPLHHRQQKRYQKQLKYLPDIKDGKILDVGCAGGGWLKIVQAKGWVCYGTDLIKSNYKEDGIDLRYGYLPEIDYPSSFFDVICAWGVMEHISKPSEYFKSIYRLLNDNGIFIFMVPNGDSLWSRWAFCEDIPRHLHFFRKKTLRKYAQKYNFKIKMIEATNDLYSRKATGRGLFRKRMLLMAGASWEEILRIPKQRKLQFLSKLGNILDYLIIHPELEELLGFSGSLIVIFEKTK